MEDSTVSTSSNVNSDPSVSRNVLQEGQYVLLVWDDHKSARFVQAKKNQKAKLGKQNVDVTAILGQKWGSVFEVINGKLKLSSHEEEQKQISKLKELASGSTTEEVEQEQQPEEEDNDEENENENDASTTSKTDGVQKMSSEKIADMRKQGVGGGTIIQALMTNSATFAEKTQFSKEKYINKKKRKYMLFVRMVKPSMYTITKYYFEKEPQKIQQLRMDSLSMMLSYANVKPFSQVLVVENCDGVVLGCAAERVGGHGRVIGLYDHSHTPLVNALKYFNFPPNIAQSIHHYPVSKLNELDSATISTETNNNTTNNQSTEQVKQWLKNGCDSLLVVSKYDPTSIVNAVWPFLLPSRPFAIFHYASQPLAALHHKLSTAEAAAGLELTETWLREHQVLPDRTHPTMRMHGASGYILSGIKVSTVVHNPGEDSKKRENPDAKQEDNTAKKQKQTEETGGNQ